MEDSQSLWLSIKDQLPEDRVTLGPAYSNTYRNDPKAIVFGASRYKFVSKMLERNASSVLEVGCGDGFGAPIVAQGVSNLVCTDIDQKQLSDNQDRLSYCDNIEFLYHDFREGSLSRNFDAVYFLDVLEHIYPSECDTFLENVFGSVSDDGCAIIGVPNKSAESYGSKFSQLGHVNMMDAYQLTERLKKHWKNVFIFGMNDEVLHTGFTPLCHYLIAVASNKV
ncbi:MAG: methyltransferase domain-containing protein [Alphaproteobacteria bacterium]|nr:methyltransferase domain-containing protein [Alphaproteobacteria bacterium]